MWLFSILLVVPLLFTANGEDCGCPSDYGFAALLYNRQRPNRTCVGAILTTFWIVDNCPAEDGLAYEYVKVGWMHSSGDVYKISEVVAHENYRRVYFKIKGYNTKYVYGAQNALFLHKTQKEIVMKDGVVGRILLYQDYCLPRRPYAVYLYQEQMTCQRLFITTKSFCDNHFRPYFDNNNNRLQLTESQFCVRNRKISPEECCYSQSLMLCQNYLMGVMAWSTVCSKEIGVDPWVFTHTAFFQEWIRKHIDWDKYAKTDRPKSLC